MWLYERCGEGGNGVYQKRLARAARRFGSVTRACRRWLVRPCHVRKMRMARLGCAQRQYTNEPDAMMAWPFESVENMTSHETEQSRPFRKRPGKDPKDRLSKDKDPKRLSPDFLDVCRHRRRRDVPYASRYHMGQTGRQGRTGRRGEAGWA